jgi:DNA-binding PadR family transcriptional regulator
MRHQTELLILAELTETGPVQRRDLRRATRLAPARHRGSMTTSAALRRLQEAGLVETSPGTRHRWLAARAFYTITGQGRRELSALRDILLARELTAEHSCPGDSPDRTMPWAAIKRAFSAWFAMPLARRSGELH